MALQTPPPLNMMAVASLALQMKAMREQRERYLQEQQYRQRQMSLDERRLRIAEEQQQLLNQNYDLNLRKFMQEQEEWKQKVSERKRLEKLRQGAAGFVRAQAEPLIQQKQYLESQVGPFPPEQEEALHSVYGTIEDEIKKNRALASLVELGGLEYMQETLGAEKTAKLFGFTDPMDEFKFTEKGYIYLDKMTGTPVFKPWANTASKDQLFGDIYQQFKSTIETGSEPSPQLFGQAMKLAPASMQPVIQLEYLGTRVKNGTATEAEKAEYDNMIAKMRNEEIKRYKTVSHYDQNAQAMVTSVYDLGAVVTSGKPEVVYTINQKTNIPYISPTTRTRLEKDMSDLAEIRGDLTGLQEEILRNPSILSYKTSFRTTISRFLSKLLDPRAGLEDKQGVVQSLMGDISDVKARQAFRARLNFFYQKSLRQPITGAQASVQELRQLINSLLAKGDTGSAYQVLGAISGLMLGVEQKYRLKHKIWTTGTFEPWEAEAGLDLPADTQPSNELENILQKLLDK